MSKNIAEICTTTP